MATLGYILIGLAIAPYIVVPILIWNTQRFGSSFHLRLIQETFLPAEVFGEFQKMSEPLIKNDFEHCFDAFSQDEFLNLRFYHRILISKTQKTWAICTAICDPEGQMQKTYMELKTELSSDKTISTHNSDLIGAPIKSSKQQALALPPQTTADLLLHIHLRGLIKKNLAGALEPQVESAAETFRRFLTEDHNEQVELGALYFDEAEKMYRPTWAGAFLIGWYSMWPLTFVRRFISNLRIRSLSKEVLNG